MPRGHAHPLKFPQSDQFLLTYLVKLLRLIIAQERNTKAKRKRNTNKSINTNISRNDPRRVLVLKTVKKKENETLRKKLPTKRMRRRLSLI